MVMQHVLSLVATYNTIDSGRPCHSYTYSGDSGTIIPYHIYYSIDNGIMPSGTMPPDVTSIGIPTVP